MVFRIILLLTCGKHLYDHIISLKLRECLDP